MDPSAGYLRQSYSSSTFQTSYDSFRHWRQMAGNGENVGGYIKTELSEPLRLKREQEQWNSKWHEAERLLKGLRKAKRRDEKAIQEQELISSEAKLEERLCGIRLILHDERDTLSKEDKDTRLEEAKNIERELRQLRGEEDLENNQKPDKKDHMDKKAPEKKKH